MRLDPTATAAPPRGQPSATDLLRAQHAELARLFEQYRAGVDGTRDEVGRAISARLRLLSCLEEDILYPVVRHEAEEAVRRAARAHAVLRTWLDELDGLSPYDPEHEAMMARVIEAAAEHIEEEEARLFPIAEARLPNTMRRIAPDLLRPAAGGAA
jgi:hypothetical protein